jgi:hypothetical protein
MPENANTIAGGGSLNPRPPFNPGASRYTGKQVDLTALSPQGEAEPTIEHGVDLSGQPKIVLAVGRGKTGKTTLLRWIAEISAQRQGSAILADIDPTNKSFARYFDDVARPETDNPQAVTRWLQELIEHCVNERQSAIVDLGGGDTTLRTLAAEMPGLATQMEVVGVSPVMLYMVGTQPEDLAPAVTLRARGFTAKAQAIVFNEVAIDAGMTRKSAFSRLMASSTFRDLASSSIQVWMPRLHAAEAVESRQCTFMAARDGLSDPPLGLFDGARVRAWLDAMDRRFEGVRTWIP